MYVCPLWAASPVHWLECVRAGAASVSVSVSSFLRFVSFLAVLFLSDLSFPSPTYLYRGRGAYAFFFSFRYITRRGVRGVTPIKKVLLSKRQFHVPNLG